MRTVLFWLASGLLVLGALSATMAMISTKWLFPAPAATAPVTTATATETTATEQLALEFVRRAGSGDAAGARALAAQIPAESYDQLGRLRPVTQRAAVLPGGQPVLVWASYLRNGHTAQGAYHVTVKDGKVTAILGPLAPNAGYKGLPWLPTDDRGRKVDLDSYSGRGLVIVAPRAPEADLVAALARLQAAAAPLGVEVILAVDLGGPDMTAYARNSGYTGLIWRIKGHLEEAPVVTQGLVLGAAGILVDRTGTVVASLAALDPARYGLDGQPLDTVAPTVFRAYGLTP